MNKVTMSGIAIMALMAVVGVLVQYDGRVAEAHCQVPCGIYDDPARLKSLYEDALTIEKAINNIQKLAGKHDAASLNQLSRWVTAKEEHATHIIDVVSEYFLTQKVKPVMVGQPGHGDYLKKLAGHHVVMVAAMKCKQDADLETVAVLRGAIHAMEHYYVQHNH